MSGNGARPTGARPCGCGSPPATRLGFRGFGRLHLRRGAPGQPEALDGQAHAARLAFQGLRRQGQALFFGQEDLERRRTLRNQLVHPREPGTPSDLWVLPDGDYECCHAELEGHARWAYELMLEAVYSGREGSPA
jgi:hypothetical protein